jgi:CrcB protein
MRLSTESRPALESNLFDNFGAFPPNNRMVIYLWVALGGALGSVGRFWLNNVVTARAGDGFPWGTLLINVLGSFAIGFFATLPATSDTAKRFLMAGVCGGFTTFSAFSLQTLELTQRGDWLRAGGNILGSVALCLVAVWLGWMLGTASK